jgi:hypothetical protein
MKLAMMIRGIQLGMVKKRMAEGIKRREGWQI